MSPSRTESFKTNARGFRRDLRQPVVDVPPGACDCHMHIVGPFTEFPLRETRSLQPLEATLEDYLRVREATGLARNIIVQPSVFAKDNACTLAASRALGDSARAVVVVDPDVDEAALQEMHAAGARGVRVQRVVAGGADFAQIKALADRIAPLGWHLQLYVDAGDLPELVPVLRQLPVDVVFDHMAHVWQDSTMRSAGFDALLDLLQGGRSWVKLSNARFAPDAARARRLIAANPQRVLWGSDWPHVAYDQGDVPAEHDLLDLLAQWAPDAPTRHAILVDNPTSLYFR